MNVAKAGLNELHKSFEFIRDGETRSVAEAMEHYTGTMETGVMHGEGSKKEFELPYQGKTLRGEQIVSLCNAWAAKGVLEPDAAKAIIGVVRNKDWSDFKNKVFVLMGAGNLCLIVGVLFFECLLLSQVLPWDLFKRSWLWAPML